MTSRMNQEKIGRLIAKLRKQKDLTQRELGEMVGVGYRAVSKWERGQTMPDISIINELSTILGITSDELLKGELNPNNEKTEYRATDNNQKSNKKIKKRMLMLFIPILVLIFILATLIIINNNNKPEEYTIQSLYPNEYLVDGSLTFDDEKIIIKINKIEFQDYDFAQTIIKEYQYNILIDNIFIFGLGDEIEYNNIINSNIKVNDFFNNIVINHDDNTRVTHKELENGQLVISMVLKDINNNIIEKSVETILISKK